MKGIISFLVLALLLTSCSVSGQIESGEYEDGLKLAYNPSTGLVTGVYENYSGYDEGTGNPKFSCIFYIHGFIKGNISEIETYYPLEKSEEMITGEIKRIEENEISIKLNDQHGGCWNVWDFSDDLTNFKLQKNKDWIEIRYIVIEKAFFYTEKQESTKRKAYIQEGDLIFVDQIEDEWIHCSFYGKTVTQGWIKLNSANQN